MTIPDTDEEELNREPGTEKDRGNQIRWRSPMVFSIVGIIVIILVAGGVYLDVVWQHTDPAPTTSPTMTGQLVNEGSPATWATYVDPQAGISFRHPADWYPHDTQPSPSFHEVFISAPIDNVDPQAPVSGQVLSVTIWQEDNQSGKTLEQWATDAQTDPGSPGPATAKYLNIDGQPALQLMYVDTPASLTAVNIGAHRLVISVSTPTQSYATYSGLIDQFLSTLSLTP